MANVPDTPLPTLDRLGLSAAPEVSPAKAIEIAQGWLDAFAAAASSASSNESEAIDAAMALLHPTEAFWRDLLVLTWNMRTFSGPAKIRAFLSARLGPARMHGFKLKEGEGCTTYQKPYEDLAWVSAVFEFKVREGREEGVGLGIFRLVPIPKANGNEGEVEWKAHTVFTNLESLTHFPEQIGAHRNAQMNHGKWAAQREEEVHFAEADADADAPPSVEKSPTVLIIGAGQSGLEVAARLKALGVRALVVEKNGRVGDNWRHRYEALCLHDPVWYDHMPYLPFPSTWPVFTPALKLANWLEFYADALELNIWTSSNITSLSQDSTTHKWTVTIDRAGVQRRLVVNHVVFCTGLGSAAPNLPVYPGRDEFEGEVLHSTQHKRALDHAGKKVVVVGACTSAHDIAVDYCQHGIDVTMFQRGSTYIMTTSNGCEVLFKGVYWENAPPVDLVDRISASFPNYMSVGLNQRRVQRIAELDKDLLDSLHRVGFRTNLGIKDTGFGLLAWSRGGGYYFDTGGSKLLADGKIKLKSDSAIKRYTPRGLEFENGTELEADIVVFATGLGNPLDKIRLLCGDAIAQQCKPIWGLDKEGEINSAWKDTGVRGLWIMLGNLALCRFHSSHVALRVNGDADDAEIKAMEEGIFGERYEA